MRHKGNILKFKITLQLKKTVRKGRYNNNKKINSNSCKQLLSKLLVGWRRVFVC